MSVLILLACFVYNTYGNKILGCKKRQLCRVNQNENFSKNLTSYAYKTESSTQIKVHISHKESRKKVKEFEKPNFVCVFAFKI